MFKIKVLTPNDSIKFWYVKSIKRGSKSFAGTTDLSDAKTYRKTKAVNALLNYFLEIGINYVLLDTNSD
ncbi:hypothetical protein [Pseudoalteromonas fuliginea]|uniref:Uncharacterized protein n=1 Tax=Pseudoalteromonas fuliginea TaxID=1872678 RepID=A0ABQ6RF06_9GAMM|nr:hypothetical protein [Pseudoalteromonas fuliginea]KAA1152086.1 hypothetical protein EU509_14920 [Pseudoalteromonas fuliginea]KAA1166183.1 hypothetical protein EUZ79_14910 [Pseudoalteromonas fuliginea]